MTKRKMKETTLEEPESQELIDSSHGPATERDHNSPTPDIEAKIMEALRKKKPAHYNSEYGLEMPSLTEEEAKSFMPPRQKLLLESYNSGKVSCTTQEALQTALEKEISFIKRDLEETRADVKSREKNLQEIRTEADIKRRGWYYSSVKDYRDHENGIIAWQQKHIASALQSLQNIAALKSKYSLLMEDLAAGYVPSHANEEIAWVQKPHGFGNCKGVGKFVAPYQIRCTKCDTEVRLWEWGVDYDVG